MVCAGGGGALYWLLYPGLTSCKPSFSSPSLLAWATGHNNVFEQIFYNFTEREAEPNLFQAPLSPNCVSVRKYYSK